jgi:hypothetical protein
MKGARLNVIDTFYKTDGACYELDKSARWDDIV